MTRIFVFDHEHKSGDTCSRATCEYARRKPTLAGSEVFDDLPMKILREATREEYLTQPIPEGWCIPQFVYEGERIYEVLTDDYGTETENPTL